MNHISDYIVAFSLLFSLIIVIVGFIAVIIPWETHSYRSRIDSEDNNEEAYNQASKHSEYWYAAK